MDCLKPEQIATYLRGRGNGESRLLEDHVRGCPGCAMELLLARETLHDLRAKGSRPATDRFRVRRRGTPWIPWAAAAAVVLAAILVFALSKAPETPDRAVAVPKPAVPAPQPRPEVARPPDKPIEGPKPAPETRPPTPEPPKPAPEPKPEPPAPMPEPRPKPEPEPTKPPEVPKPGPEPKKPAPTIVERAVVAKVTHAVGGSALGKTVLAGDTVATGRQEFVAVALDGFGSLYLRENSKAEIGANGEIILVDGEMLARLDPGRRLGALKTPSAEIDLQSSAFAVQVTKNQTELSVLDGRASIGGVAARVPGALVARSGKAAEARPLDPGFASWVPDKLAVKKFAGWFEGESFPTLQGFKVAEQPQASGGRAVVQTAEGGTAAFKSALPFKGRHAVWLRLRAYEAKATSVALHLNGQALGELKVEPEAKPWRWVGPFFVVSDRLEFAVTATSRLPTGTAERATFPVALDLVYVTTDVKGVPPEKLPEERRAFDFVVEEPGR